MSTPNITVKAYEEKISAQLQKSKAELGELEARAKDKMAQTEIDTIRQLKTKQQEIENKTKGLKTASDAKVEQIKAEIDADTAKLKTSLADLATKLKPEPRAKAS